MPEQSQASAPTFAIVVGEHSGDTLGAGLISQLKQYYPKAKFVGIGGPKMLALGFESLFDMEELAVMGIVEVLGRIRRLLHVRKSLVEYFSQNKPDVFIGIDAPDFNLTLEEKLKNNGIKTVQYVSPSVWAWREKRIFKIERATNMVLSLLPFEKAFYDKYQVPCTFVGHTLAEKIPMHSDKAQAREALGLSLSDQQKLVALMPGSRSGELKLLVEPYLQTAKKLLAKYPSMRFVVPMISDDKAQMFTKLHQELAPELELDVIVGKTQEVMAASDVLLIASGTVTLEAALVKRPMVVCYKVNALTWQIAKRMVKLKWVSLPNLLANEEIVPEFLQHDVQVDALVAALETRLFEDQSALMQRFEQIHHELKQNADEKAAQAIIALIKS
ncbi:lipid-A-disaccharide synthase [Thalassotalea sp. LPB0316]|uniref:lipid-A-disaccharide synthase n=1 Tax=Thalassotalea sp. LPB0316 TaxID=2769490 RepID=UPI0018688CDC|nr:lipid-A-disaccharide synthase [Thalassotalea sp. LPB0316]QOL24606.1 lipid-A-disaccharide synthase [Thalassotalea sp. LPB0316]